MGYRTIDLDTKLYINNTDTPSERWKSIRKIVRETYVNQLSIEDNNMKETFQACLWALSYTPGSILGEVIKMNFDGDFFDEIMENVPECERKDKIIDKITALADKEANDLKEKIEELSD